MMAARRGWAHRDDPAVQPDGIEQVIAATWTLDGTFRRSWPPQTWPAGWPGERPSWHGRPASVLSAELLGAEPGRGPPGRRLAKPCVLNYFGQFSQGELADPAGPHQHRRVAVEARCGEERRRLVLHQGLFVGFRGHPEDDHIRVALAGLWVGGVGPGRTEEHKGLAPDLVDGVATPPVHDRDMRHAQRQFVHVLHPRPARPCCHESTLERGEDGPAPHDP